MRALRAGWLVDLRSGLWVVDAVQPVAAVLDPDTGAVRTLVSWPQVPPPGGAAPHPVVLGDGESLWVQREVGDPVVRVDAGGVAAVAAVAATPSHLRLRAVGPGEAWCSSPPPGDQYVPSGRGPRDLTGHGELRRVDAHGAVEAVRVDRGVHELHATRDGLLVGAASTTWRARRWDSCQDRIFWETHWYRIPWGSPLPEHLGEEFALGDGFEPPGVPVLWAESRGLWQGLAPPAQTHRLDWFVEPSPLPPVRGPRWERTRVLAADWSGQVVASWDLPDGSAVAMASVGRRVGVAVDREPRSTPSARAERTVDVLALDPRDGSCQELLPGGTVDVGGHCWPVDARPAGAYAHVVRNQEEVQGRVERLRRAGARDVQVTVAGAWPRTLLETTMTVPARPGVRVRLQIPLFDELGRALGPQYADVHLADSLDTGSLPAAEDARDGFLDV